jgi:magnesium transporter
VFHKEHPEAGSRPGTLAIPPDSPAPRIHLVRYSPESLTSHETQDLAELRGALDGPDTVWVDVRGLGDEATLRALGEIFALHPLALEDAVNIPQRAKSEIYEHYQLIIARVPVIDAEGDDLRTPQVCLVIGPRWLLTFQERYFGFFEPVRERLRAAVGPIRQLGPDYLAYALVDTMIDYYYPIAEQLSQALEDLEDDILDQPDAEILARIHRLRRQLVVLRRVGWPEREAVSAMLREHSPFISETVRIFLRDTLDHIAQIIELVDSSREFGAGLSEVYLSTVSQRTNEVMKVLTLTATIFIPLTFVAGIYGMNFHNMPELNTSWGYFGALGAMAAIAAGMLLYFRRRGWLGRRRSRGRRSADDAR